MAAASAACPQALGLQLVELDQAGALADDLEYAYRLQLQEALQSSLGASTGSQAVQGQCSQTPYLEDSDVEILSATSPLKVQVRLAAAARLESFARIPHPLPPNSSA